MRVTRLLLIFSLVILAISSVSAARLRGKDPEVSGPVSSSGLARRTGSVTGRKTRKRSKTKRGRKNRKRSKNKGNRKGKKWRKNGKKGGNRKKKNNRRVNQRKEGGMKRSRSVSESCFRDSVGIMKLWKDLVSNFVKQKKRIERHNRTTNNKANKKGVFRKVGLHLLRVGGGDKSNLACAGSRVSQGRVFQSRSLYLETV